MTYIIDTNCFIVMGHYYPSRFPGFWKKFDELVYDERVISVREVYKELDNTSTESHLWDWVQNNKAIFKRPDEREMEVVKEIFAIERFQALLKRKNILEGSPEADPFLVACGKVRNACVVTQEKKKGNKIKIPLVCEHFDVECINLETLMEREDWAF